MNFIPEPFLVEAVEGKDIISIRTALSTYITKDLGGQDEKILNAAEYIERNYGDIWEMHDNREEESKENWDTTYLGLLQSDLMNNFSKKRLNHILEVGSFIYPKKQNADSVINSSTYTSKCSAIQTTTPRQKVTVIRKRKNPMGKYLVLAGAVAVSLMIYLIAKD